MTDKPSENPTPDQDGEGGASVLEAKLRVEGIIGEKLRGVSIFRNEITFAVDVGDIADIFMILSDANTGGFTQLSDMTVVDYPERPKRFELVYQLLSVSLNQRIRIVAAIGDGEIVPSVSHIYTSSLWSEREAWDMFGIFFSGHPDLRRLLTDYGFEGHPLRKDFPLTGTVETRYDERLGRVIYEPVNLSQEFRDFDFMSPWEGAEKAMREQDKAIESVDESD